jgi:UDP-N-acetylmuramate dehydrogenase
MNPQQNVSLRDYSTMRLGGNAAYLYEVASRQELVDAVAWADERQLQTIMIGGGSNIIWRDEGFDGLVIVNNVLQFEDFVEDEYNHYLTIGAGENWDSVVERSVAAGLSGIECLSLIPGKAGATPVQNVGAYGQEISQTLVSVEVYDREIAQFINIPNMDCAFAYRTSRFKTTDKNRFFITAITLHLTTAAPMPPFYNALQRYLEEHKISDITSRTLRDAVIDIRSHKLPDPATIANNGSFFANPIVDRGTYTQIQSGYDSVDVPHWETDSGIKLSAAWLIEQAGFKGLRDEETGMMTWPTQPLVFVNESAKTTADLLTFRQKVLDAVQGKFEIQLQQEPELLP